MAKIYYSCIKAQKKEKLEKGNKKDKKIIDFKGKI
jgi:hypothetical protein